MDLRVQDVRHLVFSVSDILIFLLWIGLAWSVILHPVLGKTFLRVIFAIPLLIIIPGYSAVSCLFPQKDGPSYLERVGLGVLVSAAIVPLLALGLLRSHFGFTLFTVTAGLAGISVVFCAVALVRRAFVDIENRFVALPERADQLQSPSRGINQVPARQKAIRIFFLGSILLAAGVTGFSIGLPRQGEEFTEFFILSENGSVSNYVTIFTANMSESMTIGIGNREHRHIDYTIEAYTQNIRDGNFTFCDRWDASLNANETKLLLKNITVSAPGDYRLIFILFKEPPDLSLPPEARIREAYRDLYLVIRVRR